MMDKLQDFWQIVVEVWQQGLWGVDVGRIMGALLIFLAFMVVRRIFSRVVLRRLHVMAAKTKMTHDELLVEALKGPVRMLPVVMGFFFAAQYAALEGTAATAADNLVRSAVIFMIFAAFYNILGVLPSLLSQLSKIFTPVMIDWLAKAVRVIFVLIGVAAILEVWGIQVAPLIAGLGLFGVAVALGAQDLFKNLISGILVIAEKRFNRGDWIKVDGVVEGTVETIGFRSTVVRRFDKAPVYVPNSSFSDKAVTNFTAMTHRRIYWKIGVEYSTTVPQLREIRDNIEKYLTENKDFAPASEVSTFVRIDSFNDSSIDIMLYCFTKTTNWGEWLEIKETLAYKVKEIVEKAGSGFAFPSQSLYIESLPDGAENFVPPVKKKQTAAKSKK